VRRLSARAAAAFCLAFAIFQAALALGAPYGQVVWGGATPVLSSGLRVASAGACVYLLAIGALMLGRAGDWGRTWPRWVFLAANILLAVQLALNTAANLAAKTGTERYGMGAASLLGCLLCLLALIARRPSAASN
jgi:hypothetical protein